ncbi:hypothetical protein EVAR_76153_1 [Eumeta japonica]|uniref:Uncharacterized protein n=1 Tax=Eumeta variegata TaxID=151549 RepID=A0A4C1UWK2_EUMVA|nr:hypothetical protein EVAR_76153_1 [Eumeta japonica]
MISRKNSILISGLQEANEEKHEDLVTFVTSTLKEIVIEIETRNGIRRKEGQHRRWEDKLKTTAGPNRRRVAETEINGKYFITAYFVIDTKTQAICSQSDFRKRCESNYLNHSNKKLCQLPPQPHYGGYTAVNRPGAKPGDVFGNVTLISFITDGNNELAAVTQHTCFSGAWAHKSISDRGGECDVDLVAHIVREKII